ncbi:hypothetical protein [Venatoribacter cucullus]|uniref:hypothetical protein n=1 Tax=Venatoribacter cucullus TaxID=2661630 RepID=UPI00223F0A87|nr:hypothetical protein [Venatoribacter cucullus]UZK03884.1 hypothetical protein GAY96_08270 [Venatoribacter cucullus]
MSFRCPYCQSRDIQTFKPATRLSAAIGTIGGVTQGIDSFQKGMQIGAKTAAHSGYLGVVGGILLGGIVGGIAGCMAGKKLGELVDENVTGNGYCNACDRSFSLNTQS